MTRKESQVKYSRSEKGKLAHRKANAKHRKTDKGKLTVKRGCDKWEKSENGRSWRARQRVRDREKIQARHILHNAIRAGRLIRGPCQNCDAVENVEGHHEDYRQPLVVIWFCGGCHRLRHN